MVRLCSLMARVDVGCVRFHDFSADHGANFPGVPRPADGSNSGLHHHIVDAAGWGDSLGLVVRPEWPADTIYDLHCLVLRVQLHRWVLADFLVLVPLPGATWHWHGSGVASGRSFVDGVLARAL